MKVSQRPPTTSGVHRRLDAGRHFMGSVAICEVLHLALFSSLPPPRVIALLTRPSLQLPLPGNESGDGTL